MKNEDLMLQILKGVQDNIKDLKEDQKIFRSEMNDRFEKVDQRFEKIDQRFEKIDQRFEKIDQRFEKSESTMNEFRQEIRSDLKHDRSRLDDIYDTRHEVEYKITRDFILKNLGWNAVMIVTGIFLTQAVLN